MGVFWFENEENAADMQGTKQNQTNRLTIVPKKLWRSRAKSQTRVSTSNACSWMPEGNCRWRTENGRRVNLPSSFLLTVSEAERLALQQIALTKLRSMNLGCRIDIPKADMNILPKVKRRPILLRNKARSAGVDGRERKDRDSQPERMVFGIPLQQCIQNERLLRHRCSTYSLLDNDDGASASPPRGNLLEVDSWRLGDSPNTLSTDNSENNYDISGRPGSFDLRLSSSEPQIPNIVNSCFRHLEEYGMHTLGLFRVSSSRRRVRQLREDLDSGQLSCLNESHHPHDVAQVLKEYFRDLPQPLLTRDLYYAFLASQKHRSEAKRLDIFRYLIYLLPVQNRDTLWALLNFLSNVAKNASDTQGSTGDWHSGNKMDSMNLATLFGPNILHTSKGGKESGYAVDRVYRPEEYSDLIAVVQQLIDNSKKLLVVPPDDLDSAYRRLLIEDPNALQALLKKHYIHQLELETNENDDNSAIQQLDFESSRINDKNNLVLPIITISGESKNDKCKLPDDDDFSNALLAPPGYRDESPKLRRKSFPDHIVTSLIPSITPSLKAPIMTLSDTKDNSGNCNQTIITTTSRIESSSNKTTTTKKEVHVTSQSEKLIEDQAHKEKKYLTKPDSNLQIEKSASASSISNARKQETKVHAANKSSVKSNNRNKEHVTTSTKSALYVIPSHERNERSRSTQRSLTRGNCQQETWKRWELIASEHSQF